MASAEQPFNEREQVRESLHRTRESSSSQTGLTAGVILWIRQCHKADTCVNSATFWLNYSKSPPSLHSTSSDSFKTDELGQIGAIWFYRMVGSGIHYLEFDIAEMH